MSAPYLFAYGSLRSDLGYLRPRQSAQACGRLAAKAALEGLATVSGRLFLPAWYPGFEPGQKGQVRGEVWRLSSAAALDPLDAFEGEAYVRETISAQLSDGRRVTAHVYRYIGSIAGVPEIASGDYLDWMRNST